MELLEKALNADGDARITLLEQAWAACPHPAIADLIFLADPRDFALQGDTLADTEDAIARVGAVDDPRASAAQAAFLAALPYTSDLSRPMWTAFFESLRDPRFATVDPATFQVRDRMQRWLVVRLAEVRERLQGTLPDPPDPALIARLRAAIAPAGPRDEAELLAQIWANPEDDAPRAVYADWLTERGDPRGEFIALQLTGEQKRSKKLLKGNELAWAGPIADALAKKDLVYERGFVARAHTKFKHEKAVAELGDHPAWGTLVEILGVHVTHEFGKSRYTNHVGPTFIGLRTVRGFAWGGVLVLAEGGPWRIEHLEVEVGIPEAIDALLALDSVPELRTLVLTRTRGNPAWLWRCPFLPSLRELSVDHVDPRILERAQATGIERLTFRTSTGHVHFARDAAGQLVQAAVDRDPGMALAILGGDPSVRMGEPDRPHTLDVSPDGSELAVAWGPRIRFFDAQTLAHLRDIEDVGAFHHVRYNRAGTEIAAHATSDPCATVFEVATGAVLRRVRSRTAAIRGMDWTRDDRLVTVAPLMVEGQELRPGEVPCVACLDDGWLALGGTGEVTFLPLTGGDRRPPLPCGTQVVNRLASRGDLLAAVASTHLHVFRLSDRTLLWEVDLGAWGWSVAFARSGDRLLVGANGWRVYALDGTEVTAFGEGVCGAAGWGASLWHVADGGITRRA